MKRILVLLLAIIMMLSLVSCGGDKSGNTDTTVNVTNNENDGVKEPEEKADTIVMLYGTNHYEEHEATFHLPPGAYFDEEDYEEYLEDGYMYSFTIYDDEKDYTATAKDYWSRPVYSSDPAFYSVMQQLYFDGGLDKESAEEYSNCTHTVTELGFDWEGNDVLLIETEYTSASGFEYEEAFVGTEYEIRYWRIKENGEVDENLTAPGLVGFEIENGGWDKFSTEQYAWIAAELFGVKTDFPNPFGVDSIESEVVTDFDENLVIGHWAKSEDDWERRYVFNDDNSGCLYTPGGRMYPFEFGITGNEITLCFEDNEEDSYTLSVEGDELSLEDVFGNISVYTKTESKSETELAAEAEEHKAPESIIYSEEDLIGTWVCEDDGETYTFNADGTGNQIYKDENYTFTYEFGGVYLHIDYDDGDSDVCRAAIDGDTLTLADKWTYTRQK